MFKLFTIGVVTYLTSTILSYFVFTSTVFSQKQIVQTSVPEIKKEEGGRLAFDDKLPKTEECPLNGVKYSKQQRQWWEKHRPLGVMIENHQEARPQSGISAADTVYEVIAEGGITRFLAVFYCQDGGIVGPVRSARTYFLDFISEYGSSPLYTHVGGANKPGPADALGQIENYGWQGYNDLNQFSIGFPTFWRDYERFGHPVATEHTVYSSTEKLWKIAESRGLKNTDKKGNAWNETFTPYSFKDDAAFDRRPESQVISFNFWEGYNDYVVQWMYDKATNMYLRTNGGVKHIDKDTGKQLAAKNVIILFMRESRANDGYEGNLHMLYGTKGGGKATIFMDGKEIAGTWSKKDRTSRTKVMDANGTEIKFNRGLLWFEVLGIGTSVAVK